MVIKQLVLKKRSNFSPSNLVFLKDFDKTKLKITQHDCADRSIYHIDYAKTTDNINPLSLIIPEVYRSIEEQKVYKYLIIESPIDINKEVLTDYKKIWDEILRNIDKINNSAYVFKDYHKIKIGSAKCEDESYLESYLEQCLYDDEWFKK